MAQTTGWITGKDLTIEVSTDDSTYTSIGGSSNSVEPGGGASKKGSAHTFGTMPPIVSIGKPEAVDLKLNILYTEVSGEAADLLQGYFENQTAVYLRYRPKGAGTGLWQFKGLGYFYTPVTPKIDSDNANPIAVTINWWGAQLAKTAQA